MRKSVSVALAGALLAGIATATYFQQTSAMAPGFGLPDLEGNLRQSTEWDGKVVVVNFWAPWCPPCRREIPELMALQREYADQGLVVVGITVDTIQNTRDFAVASDIQYPLLIAEQTGMALAARFGSTIDGLPFTAVIDRSGRIAYTHPGAITLADAVTAIKPLL